MSIFNLLWDAYRRLSQAARHAFMGDAIAQSIAYQVRALRERKGWTVKRLAEESGVHYTTIARIEKGRRAKGAVTVATLIKIAAALDVALIVRFVSHSEMIAHLVAISAYGVEIIQEFINDQEFQGENSCQRDMNLANKEEPCP